MLTIIGSLALLITLLTLAVMAGLFWRLELGLLGLIAFLPFERIPSLDVAGFTVKINHIFGGLVLLVWLLTVLAGKRRIQPNPLILPTLLFMASLTLSLVGATAGQRAVFSLAATFFSLSLGLLIPQLLVKTEQLPLLLKVLGGTTLVAVIFGFYQFLGDLAGLPVSLTGLDPGYTKIVFGFPRIQAFSQEPLYFGNFLLLPISLGIALLTLPRVPWSRSFLIGALATIMLAFIFTLSRGAFLGLAASLLVLLLILGKHLLKPKLMVIGLISLMVVGLATVGFLSVAQPGALTEFTSHVTVKDFGRGDSTVGRLSSWYQALDIWQTSPWIGVGFGNFGPASLGYPRETPAHGWPIANNQYLELLAETGLIGTLTFVIFILCLLGRSWSLIARQSRGTLLDASLVGATAAVIGILVQYNFFSTLYINPIWITVGLLVAFQNLAAESPRTNPASVKQGGS